MSGDSSDGVGMKTAASLQRMRRFGGTVFDEVNRAPAVLTAYQAGAISSNECGRTERDPKVGERERER